MNAQSQGFASYSVQDGLAQSNVFDITEDHLGNLWLATEGGLCKFNGVSFYTYTTRHGLPSNLVRCADVDNEGNLWLGTDKGISRFDGSSFVNYSIPSLSTGQYVNLIEVDREGNLWYATTSGSIAIRPRKSDTTLTFNSVIQGRVSGFAEVNDGIWISTFNNGIYRYIDKKVQKVSLPNKLNTAVITAIYADHQQQIWLGTDSGLFAQVDEEFQFVHSFHGDNQGLGIYSICEEKEGSIWVGTTKGAFRYRNGVCSPVNSNEGLTDNIIYKIHRDREGSLWLGSFGGGVFKSLGDLFTNIGKGQGVSYDYISSITKDRNGAYWFGSYGGGVYKVAIPGEDRPMSISNIDQEEGLSNDFTYDLVTDRNGDIWIATGHGLNYYRQGKITTYHEQDGLPSEHIYSVRNGSDGNVYAGTSKGFVKIEPGSNVKFTNYKFDGGASDNKVRTITPLSNGDFLLCTFGGLKIFDGRTISNYFNDDSLRSRPVSSVLEDADGNLWCALIDNGILKWDPNDHSGMIIDEDNGLSSNIVYTIVMDYRGHLWVGTPHGLDKLVFDGQGQIESIRQFGAHEGMVGLETNTNAIYNDEDGSIWFGTVEGVYKCNPENDQVNNLEPITRITGVNLFAQPVQWQEFGYETAGWSNVPDYFQFPYQQNHLTFQFLGTSLVNPDKVRYQYKLENFDKDWQPVTKKSEAVYTNLPPGNYRFLVKAANNDGIWNAQPSFVKFEITPPFWRTWWFFSLGIVILLVGSRIAYKSRVQKKLKSLIQVEKLKTQEIIKVRRRVADDFHDQVGNQLASITVLVQLIQAKLPAGNREVDELLRKLGQFTKTLFTGTRDFIWSIDPKSDRVNEMLIYIRDFGEELFEYSDVNFHVETNNSFDAKAELPIGWSRHIVFIFKEALTNSLKHASCKNVYLSFLVTDSNYHFELRDDGKGLNGYREKEYFQLGIQNMRERANQIGGEFLISSNSGSGTKIILEGKIPQYEG